MPRGSATRSKPFNPKDYERPGINISEVEEIKEAFDLFDYEGKGSIDPAGSYSHRQSSAMRLQVWATRPKTQPLSTLLMVLRA